MVKSRQGALGDEAPLKPRHHGPDPGPGASSQHGQVGRAAHLKGLTLSKRHHDAPVELHHERVSARYRKHVRIRAKRQHGVDGPRDSSTGGPAVAWQDQTANEDGVLVCHTASLMDAVPRARRYYPHMSTSVLVLGAGFGGLEFSSHLSALLGDAVSITLIDRADGFVFGFSKLDVMYGKRELDDVRLRYAELVTPGVTFRQETITSIDPERRSATTDQGTYTADIMVVALGAEYDIAATPGLEELGNEFYSVAGARRLRDIIPTFTHGTAVIGVTSTPFKCPPAPSEAAFLLDESLRERGIRDQVQIKVVMPFGRPVPPSPETSAAILERFAERGIEFVKDHLVTALERNADGTRDLVLNDGSRMGYDLFLGIPKHRVSAVVAASGMTENGWIPVEPRTAATRYPGVYALGDVTSVGTPKAGVFAEGAANRLAEQTAARLRGAATMPEGYDGTGTCWIELGQGEVGKVAVDFFTVPGQPSGTFWEPTPVTRLEKEAFGAVRRRRWFGLDRA